MDKSWEEILPNTFIRAKLAFFERCKNDKEFRKQMIKEGLLEVSDPLDNLDFAKQKQNAESELSEVEEDE